MLRDWLHKITGKITKQARYRVELGRDFEWSEQSSIYNLFREYEYWFGRKDGIAFEGASSVDEFGNEYHIFGTWENLLVHVEYIVRSFFKVPDFGFKLVPIRQAALAGLPIQHSPFLFAVAYDNSQATTSATTLSCTVSGSNGYLFASSQFSSNGSGITATFNSVAMNASAAYIWVGSSNPANGLYLAGPSTGTNTLSASNNGGGLVANSYSGVDQGAPDQYQNTTSAGTTITLSINTATANCWMVMFTQGQNGTASASTNATLRQAGSPGASEPSSFDSNGVITTGGFSMTVDGFSAQSLGANGYSFAAVGVAPLTFSVTDSTAVTATPTVKIYGTFSVTDSTAVTSTVTNIKIFGQFTVTNSSVVTDTIKIQTVYQDIETETTAVSDTPEIALAYTDIETESTAVSDTVKIEIISEGIDVTDSTAVSDTPTLEIFSFIDVSESTAISDIIEIQTVYTDIETESTAVTDTVKIEIIDEGINITDSTTVSDTSIIETVIQDVETETTAVSDTPILEIFSLIAVTDSTALSDTPTLEGFLSIAVTDSTAVTAISQIAQVDTDIETETTVVSDTPIIETVCLISVSDTTQVKEFIQMGSAIVYDNSASFSGVLTSISGAYTTSGVNRTLIAIVYSASSLFDIQNPTYGGVVMSDADEIALPSGYPGYLAAYILTAPASGSNTFSVTRTGTGATFSAVVASYYNTEQDGDADGTSTTSALLVNSITTSVVSTFNNDWTIMGVVSGLNGTITAGGGSFSRVNTPPLWLLDSNGSVGASGTHSMTANSSSSVDGLAAIILSIAPYIWYTTQPYFSDGEDVFVIDSSAILITYLVPNVIDSSAVSATPTIELFSFINVSDSSAVSDTPILEIISLVNVTDSSVVTATPMIELVSLVNVTDSTTVSDSPTSEIFSFINVTDSTAISDAAIFDEEISYVFVGDTTAISDTAIINIPVKINVSDSTVVSDIPSIAISVLLTVTDSTAVTTVPIIEEIDFISVIDSTAVSDTVKISIKVTPNITDSTAISDTPNLEIISYIRVTDSTAITDMPSLQVVVLTSVTDSTVVVDTVKIETVDEGINVTDIVVIGESVQFDIITIVNYAQVGVQLGWHFNQYVLQEDSPNVFHPITFALQLGWSYGQYIMVQDPPTILQSYISPNYVLTTQ